MIGVHCLNTKLLVTEIKIKAHLLINDMDLFNIPDFGLHVAWRADLVN